MSQQQRGKGSQRFCDQRNMDWKKELNSLRESALLINEEVMLGRLEDRLATPLCMCSLEWKMWQWSSSLFFQNPSTREVMNG